MPRDRNKQDGGQAKYERHQNVKEHAQSGSVEEEEAVQASGASQVDLPNDQDDYSDERDSLFCAFCKLCFYELANVRSA